MANFDTPELGVERTNTYGLPATPGATFERGKMVSLDTSTGLLIPTVPGVVADYVAGISLESGTVPAYGAVLTFRSDGIFRLANDGSVNTDDKGKLCYAVSDTTVSEDSATGNPSVAGTIYKVDSRGVWVSIDHPLTAAVSTFTPLGLVLGWRRLADRTDTGTLIIPDALGGPDSVQATPALKPTFGVSGGLPIAIHNNQFTEQAFAAAVNNTTPKGGWAGWVRPTTVTGGHTWLSIHGSSGASEKRISIVQNNTDLLFDISTNGVANATATASGALTINEWIFLTLEYNGDLTTDALRCVVTIDTVPQSLSFVGTMPAALRQPTGTISHGAFSGGANGLVGEMGANDYWITPLSPDERENLMNFEPPV